MMATLLYNTLLLVVDALFVRQLQAKRTIAMALGLAIAAAAAGLAMAALLGEDRFGFLRLVTWGVFGHGIVLSLGTALLLWRPRRGWSIAAAVLAGTLALIAVDAFLIEPEWLELSHVTIATAKVARPCRIAVLADFQVDRIGPYERRVIERLVETKADIILLAGDYVQAAPGEREQVRSDLRDLLRAANLAAHARVYAVQGDMEDPGWEGLFSGLNYTTASATESFDLGDGLRLTCLAVDASFSVSTSVTSDPQHFHLVLGHCPNFALGRVPADLLIAGHTHGGQVQLPLIGPLITLSRVPRHWAYGLTELSGGRRLLVSRGAGMERGNAPRLRFFCRPEVVVIDLAPESR